MFIFIANTKNFFEVFPVKLGGMLFDSKTSEDLYASVDLKYVSWEFEVND